MKISNVKINLFWLVFVFTAAYAYTSGYVSGWTIALIVLNGCKFNLEFGK